MNLKDRDELLTRLDERTKTNEKEVQSVKELIQNHLMHHFWINITLLTSVLGLVAILLLK